MSNSETRARVFSELMYAPRLSGTRPPRPPARLHTRLPARSGQGGRLTSAPAARPGGRVSASLGAQSAPPPPALACRLPAGWMTPSAQRAGQADSISRWRLFTAVKCCADVDKVACHARARPREATNGAMEGATAGGGPAFGRSGLSGTGRPDTSAFWPLGFTGAPALEPGNCRPG